MSDKLFIIFSIIFILFCLVNVLYGLNQLKKGVEYEKVKKYNHIAVLGLNLIGLISCIRSEQYYMLFFNFLLFLFYFLSEINYYKKKVEIRDWHIKELTEILDNVLKLQKKGE